MHGYKFAYLCSVFSIKLILYLCFCYYVSDGHMLVPFMLYYLIEDCIVICLNVLSKFACMMAFCCYSLSGLDTCLLPIRLDHLTGDFQKIICRYRDLADGYYADAVKHLRLALRSIQPANASLLPLVQVRLKTNNMIQQCVNVGMHVG